MAPPTYGQAVQPSIYMVFHKKTPFCFLFIFTQMMINLHKILPVVAKEILIQNISTKYGS